MSSQDHYTEKTICFGPENSLIGTLCVPVSPPLRSLPGLILLNAGVLSRIGPHRLNVDIARMAALQGIPAIRFDLPGVGDSAFTRIDLPREQQELAAITAAMSQLARTPCAPNTFLITGFCSGADLGFNMALQDERIVGLTMIEPYYYPNALSRPLQLLRRMSEYGLRRAIPRIREMLSQRTAAAQGETTSRPAGRAEEKGIQGPCPQAFAASLKTLLDRKVRIELIYASSLMGSFDLWMHKRQIFRPFLKHPNFRVALLPDTDHSFTTLSARQQLLQQMKRGILAGPLAPADIPRYPDTQDG